jgi:hypothetical protein
MEKRHAFCLIETESFYLFRKERLTRILRSCLSVRHVVSSPHLLAKRPKPYRLNLEKGQTSLKVAGNFVFSAILPHFQPYCPIFLQ